jgi:hypothetical protein
MSTISGKQLLGSLNKAKKLGVVELSFDLDGCSVTLRSLRPSEYEAILAECEELEEVAYMNAFQKAHVARSIQQLDDIDFREVDFVEVDEPDPKKPGHTRVVKHELHSWMRKNVVDTWGKEALHSAFRKFAEVVDEAEKKAKKGLTFLTPDETSEEAFRRQVAEMKAIQDEVPPALVLEILHEHGYDLYTHDENAAALSKLDKVAEDLGEHPRDMEAADKAREATPEPEPAEAPPQPVTPTPVRRVPLNQVDVEIPTPEPAPIPAPQAPAMSRAQLAMAQEMELNPDFERELQAAKAAQGDKPIPLPASDIPTLEKAKIDVAAVQESIDRPPTLGFNPKFRKPQR